MTVIDHSKGAPYEGPQLPKRLAALYEAALSHTGESQATAAALLVLASVLVDGVTVNVNPFWDDLANHIADGLAHGLCDLVKELRSK